MSYKDFINGLEPINYSKYKDITSYEKLMSYAALILKRNNIPITFNYLCVASFKLFPDAFCCDEEFKEFPSVDRLNRTLMHLKYVKTGYPALEGSPKIGYTLTKTGEANALDTESIITNSKLDLSIKAPSVDKHKKGKSGDYTSFIEGKDYLNYLTNGKVDVMYVWKFYKITPYTQISSTKKNLNNILEYAKDYNDQKCVEFVTKVLELL